VLLSDRSSKALQKNGLQKNRVACQKAFTKKSTKKSKAALSRFWAFLPGEALVRGVQKHDKKISRKNLTSPGTFLASEEPTNHQKARQFVFECPLTGHARSAKAKCAIYPH
jgi:hypothetical protein